MMANPLRLPTLALLALAAAGPVRAQPGAAQSVPPVLPIAEVVADRDADTIPDGLNRRFSVRGVTLVGNRALQAQNYQLLVQDESGGLSLYTRSQQADVEAGQVVEASGTLGQFRGAPQLFIDRLEVVGEAPLPAPRAVPLAEVDSWQHLGRRVRVEGLAGPLSLEGYGRLRIDGDDGTTLSLYIPQAAVDRFDWSLYPRGARLEVTGVSSLYKETWPYDGGFQLVVTSPEDIRVLAPPTPPWVRWGLYASLPAAALVALSLLVFASMQRKQRLRQQELATLGALSTAFAEPEGDAAQLSRRACETLSAYGVTSAVCVHLVGEDGALVCVARSADTGERQQALDRLLAAPIEADDLADGPAEALARAGLPTLACHPLPASEGRPGWLSVPSMGQQRLNAMQQRVLLAAVKLLGLALENRRIREQAERERAALHRLAVTDELTGLYNRRFLDEYLRMQVPVARRRGSGLAFLSIDIDHFKSINDRFGHPAGDAVLRHVAAALRAASRSSDLPVRMGGEEFLVVAAEADLEGTIELAERLRRAVESIDLGALGIDPGLRVTVSIGVAQFGVHGEESEGLIQASDEALYEAKRGGRNRVAVAGARAAGTG
ncbi:diguanylate cyclase [Pseudomarimonas salicorniae]|uniref:diguanylate cyclase n=1 Tax=Pseudomarimonas salicorniae TaxID=2933270 RepID=A0ABT0GKF6_9GAMM|nr:diguanylate cyclase [Lysobacter sp. CAU 1642]MCK7595027.1 diguanylate cyclase [Lysobacter sp. CAU 1642]